jgi:hypothetical protein
MEVSVVTMYFPKRIIPASKIFLSSSYDEKSRNVCLHFHNIRLLRRLISTFFPFYLVSEYFTPVPFFPQLQITLI